MSQSCPEELPLLSEEFPEDQLRIKISKHLQPMVLRGRARLNAKGAAAIIKLWPDYWISTVTIWWIALGMIAIIIFITYNSIVIVTASPIKYFRDIQRRTSNESADLITKGLVSSNSIFMHLVVDINAEVDLGDYLPYIDVIISKYPEFDYNFYILINDSATGTPVLNAEQNNKHALNLLWPNEDFQYGNISIYHLSLSEFLENTPLKNSWRNIISTDHVDFLIRAVSIWDKGGIAFSPRIMTPWSEKSSIKEKLFDVFNKYHNLKTNDTMKQTKSKKKINNIRDIIEALEDHESELPIFSIQNPIEAETIITSLMTKNIKTIDEKTNDAYEAGKMHHNLLTRFNSSKTTKSKPANITDLDKLAMNLILSKIEIKTHKQKQKVVTRKRKHIISSAAGNRNAIDKDKENVRQFTSMEHSKHNDEETNTLTIDLRGNILASALPCHVFLGSLFSHLNNYVDISVTDFIVKELTYFCKNTISNCSGIDVIVS